MTLDRRNPARRGLGRRRGDRTPLFDQISWRPEGERKLRRGVLVGMSPTGVAMLTEHKDTPSSAAQIVLGRMTNRRNWNKTAVVTRTEQLSELLDLVAVEYTASGNGR